MGRTPSEEPVPRRADWELRFMLLTAAALAALGVLAGLPLLLGSGTVTLGGDLELVGPKRQQDLLRLGQSAFFVGAIAWLIWFRRLYATLPDLGARGLRHSPRWAVWAWLVPGINLVRPLHMTADAWRACDPGLPAEAGTRWRSVPVPPLLPRWWALLLGCRLATAVALTRFGEPVLPVLAQGLNLAAALAALRVVGGLTERQEDRTLAFHIDRWRSEPES